MADRLPIFLWAQQEFFDGTPLGFIFVIFVWMSFHSKARYPHPSISFGHQKLFIECEGVPFPVVQKMLVGKQVGEGLTQGVSCLTFFLLYSQFREHVNYTCSFIH